MKDSPGTTLNKEEIWKAVRKMKCDKAPGTSQLTIDMLKTLPNDTLNFVIETIQDFWQQEIDFKAWHVTKLNILYKGTRETNKTSASTEAYV